MANLSQKSVPFFDTPCSVKIAVVFNWFHTVQQVNSYVNSNVYHLFIRKMISIVHCLLLLPLKHKVHSDGCLKFSQEAAHLSTLLQLLPVNLLGSCEVYATWTIKRFYLSLDITTVN